MPRITRAGGVTDARPVPETHVAPSVDEMLRRREPTPAPDADAVDELEPAAPTPGGSETPDAGDSGDSGSGDAADAAPTPPPAEATTAEVRAWARGNGFEVADAGPIPKDVQAAYDAAHPAPTGEG